MRSPLSKGTLIELDEVDSTQSYAMSLLRKSTEKTFPTVILAKHQTQGRGRLQRKWISGPGDSLTMSLLFTEYADHPQPWLIGMSVACAAAGALHCGLRWPNDLVFGEKKVGGILTEIANNSEKRIPVVGVGINLNQSHFPDELAQTATSLLLQGFPKSIARDVAENILSQVEDLPEPKSWDAVRAIWNLYDCTPGKAFTLADGRHASAVGIGPNGELLCSVDGALQTVHAADALLA